MFRKWLNENKIESFDLSAPLFPTASDREFWSTKCNFKAIKKAKTLLGCDWPLVRATQFMEFEISGDRMAQENPHFERRRKLAALVIGELTEYEGRFLADITDGLFAICEESYWGLSAHKAYYGHKSTYLPNMKDPYVDLFAAETAATLAVTYYLLYDELSEFCPDILSRIEYELEHKVINPYLAHTDWFWMGYSSWVNNWNPWILSNLMTVFLLTEKRKSVLCDGIKKMIFEIQRYYECTPADGGCDEGATYWGVAGGALCEFLDQLYIASDGKINFFTDDKVKRILKYEESAYIGNGYFTNFADGETRVGMELSCILYTAGMRCGDKSLMSFAKELGHGDHDDSPRLRRTLFSMILEDEIEKMPDFVPQNRYLFPALQCSFVRRGGWYYAAKGGHNSESHNHNDVGSFIAYHDNRPILVDPSCGTYTKKTFSPERFEIWTMQSGWHNLPVINGVEEKDGLEFAADGFAQNGDATEISFAGAYPENAGVRKLIRKINITEDELEFSDCFELSKSENTVSERFICVSDIRVSDNTLIIGNEFVLSADKPCKITLDSVDFEGDEKLINMWDAQGLKRAKFIFDCDSTADISFKLRRI